LILGLAAGGVCPLVAGLSVTIIDRIRLMRNAAALRLILLLVGVAVQAQYWNVMPI